MQAEDYLIPGHFDVAVLVECRPGVTRWLSHTWTVIGLVAGQVAAVDRSGPTAESLPADDANRRLLWRGCRVRLHADEAESYYHNLMTPAPQAFVVMRTREGGDPYPAFVTLCFDEANAYTEGDEDVHNVPMPPELMKWLEAYVIAHYVPELRKKRKRREWSEPAS